MALSTNTYYSNSIQGQPQVGVDVNIETADAAPRYAAGYSVVRADGNKFRYCHVGTVTNSGLLVGPTTASGGAAYAAAVVVASASATAVAAEYPILPGQVGSHYIQVTIANIAANKYQGGYIIITGGTGVGQTYRIVGNTATNNPTTGTLYIQLAEALQVAVTAIMGVLIVPSMFTDLAASATTSTQCTGVLMATTTSTNLWAWVQTHGVVGCAEDGTNAIVAGQQVQCSRVTAGYYASIEAAVTTTLIAGAFDSPIIGYSITPSVASTAKGWLGAIYLQLE